MCVTQGMNMSFEFFLFSKAMIIPFPAKSFSLFNVFNLH